jgi:hypothetical protein
MVRCIKKEKSILSDIVMGLDGLPSDAIGWQVEDVYF